MSVESQNSNKESEIVEMTTYIYDAAICPPGKKCIGENYFPCSRCKAEYLQELGYRKSENLLAEILVSIEDSQYVERHWPMIKKDGIISLEALREIFQAFGYKGEK
jgi:methylphosphotriester-DNA--protein-cysteine methyltransferase